MRTFILVTLLIAALSSGIQEQLMKDLFAQWKLTHNKVYSSQFEDASRFEIFAQNYLDILEFNAKESDVSLGLNMFADLTSEEFGTLYTGFNGQVESTGPFHYFEEVNDFPASVDWRAKGAVTPVKNQGSCGSCWTFSTTGALEGLYFLNNSNLVSFSEQQLVDCVTADQGCNGGLMSDAFAYVAQTKGIDTEADYPYEAKDGKCRYNPSKSYNTNTAYVNVTPSNVDQMKAAIVSQPVSVAIQANQLVFQFYTGGVIKKFCGDNLDHGVLVVGYDTISGTEAYIVKNSWGSTWGNSGYVYISTDGSANKGKGVCGILTTPAIPTKN